MVQMQAPARHVAPLGHYCRVNIRPVEILRGRIIYLVITFSTVVAVSLKVRACTITGCERAISTDASPFDACCTTWALLLCQYRALSLGEGSRYLTFTFSTILAVSLKVGTGAITRWETAVATFAGARVTDGSA